MKIGSFFSRYLKVLPGFLIIGAQKGGTTSLASALANHPSLVLPAIREVHFFDLHYQRGVKWYRNQFAVPAGEYLRKILLGKPFVAFESSPYYLFEPRVPARVYDLLPEVRSIVLLRNPIDRAYSQYQHHLRIGGEHLSFEDALRAESERLDGEVDKMLADGSYLSASHRIFSYLARGIYADQLTNWLNYFPKSQLMIVQSEEFFRQPANVFRQVLEYLDLPPWEPDRFVQDNAGTYAPMNPKTRAWLRAYFAPHNQRLYALLEKDYGWE